MFAGVSVLAPTVALADPLLSGLRAVRPEARSGREEGTGVEVGARAELAASSSSALHLLDPPSGYRSAVVPKLVLRSTSTDSLTSSPVMPDAPPGSGSEPTPGDGATNTGAIPTAIGDPGASPPPQSEATPPTTQVGPVLAED